MTPNPIPDDEFEARPTPPPWTHPSMHSLEQRAQIQAAIDAMSPAERERLEKSFFAAEIDDLTPCDPPAPCEPVGALLTDPKAINAFIETVREDPWTVPRPPDDKPLGPGWITV